MNQFDKSHLLTIEDVYARRNVGNAMWEIRPMGHWFCGNCNFYHTFELTADEFLMKYELGIDDFIHNTYTEYNVYVWNYYKLKNNETKLR